MSEIKFIKTRIAQLFLSLLVIFMLLVTRMFYIQTVEGASLKLQAQNIQTKVITLDAKRGNIYDRNKNILVQSLPCYAVYASPNLIKNPRQVAEKLAPLIGLDRGQLQESLSTKKSFVWLKRNVDIAVGDQIKQMKVNGLGIIDAAKRVYPQEKLAAAVLGFTGDDNQGLTGIEKSYNQALAGMAGEMTVTTDALGRMLPDTEKIISPVKTDNNLVLTIDQNIQYYVEQELAQIDAAYSPKRAVILVMNPHTGEILAMGSSPGFAPDSWQSYPAKVWESNPATSYTYEPGSVFKLFTAAAALSDRIVNRNDYFNDTGCLVVQGHKIYDSERQNYGYVSFDQGLTESLNIVFAQVGQRIGAKKFYEYIRGFGFGHSTGIDLPGDEPGLVIPETKCTSLNLAEMSFGQAITVTPLQILTATCALANGGDLMRPYLVKEIDNDAGQVVKQFKPQVVRKVISPETAQEEIKMMENVVANGTGQNAMVSGYSVAGKTGTAQVPGPGGYQPGQYVSSFVGFAPAQNPKVAVLVVVDQPHNKYYGGDVSAPVFSDLTGKILSYWSVPPDPKKLMDTGSAARNQSGGRKTVPNVLNYPVTVARWLINDQGFKCASKAEAGIVVSQSPRPGSRLTPRTEVSLTVSKKPDAILLPDLTGLTMGKANTVLADLGLSMSISGSGYAARQNPRQGTVVTPGTVVSVYFNP